MGSWSVNCGISNIAITSGNKCVLLPLKENKGDESKKWQAATLPIFGQYNDYGGIDAIEIDDNTKLIAEHFGVSIEEFATFLVDGKFTYNRDEAQEVAAKIKNLDECKKWRFMWIDRQVYDFMIINYSKHNKGYLDYGTPEMLKLLGFKLIAESDDFKNYDPKRFNQLWKKGNVEMFSDSTTLLSKNGKFVYHYGKGDESSIETYFEVPKELEYLKNKTKNETWRLLSTKDAKAMLSPILGSRYDFNGLSEMVEEIRLKNIIAPTILYKKYYANLEMFGDKIVHLINMIHNLYPMSGQFVPHVLYLTPQCGEYKKHQSILEKFAEINKTYIEPDDDTDDYDIE